MSGELLFEVVVGRLKTALELRSFNALAKALGMSSSAFANRKQAGSLPLEAIIRLALEHGLSLDWVFTGHGDPFLGKRLGARVTPLAEIDRELFSLIFSRLWNGYLRRMYVSGDLLPHSVLTTISALSRANEAEHRDAQEIMRETAKAVIEETHAALKQQAVECNLLSTYAYNRVASIESKQAREEAAKAEADQMLNVRNLIVQQDEQANPPAGPMAPKNESVVSRTDPEENTRPQTAKRKK